MSIDEFFDCYVYPHLASCTGWTWEYIDENMTLPRWYSMRKYWDKCPPVHILVRDYLGYKPPKKSSVPSKSTKQEQYSENSNSLEDLIADFSAAGGIVNL